MTPPTLTRRFTLLLAAASAFTAPSMLAVAQTAPAPEGVQIRNGPWGFDLEGMNRAVKPGDDFFAYANGGFIDALQIPPDRSNYGIDPILAETAERRVRGILEGPAPADPSLAADARKTKALYAAFMNQGTVDALGAKPLQAGLDLIRAASSRDALAAFGGLSAIKFGGSVFDLGIQQDAKAPDRYAVYVEQGGLGLPDRDYYLQAGFAEQRAKYQAYVAEMLRLAGWPDPDGSAPAVVAFERQLAEVSWSRIERRDPVKGYTPMTVAELSRAAPGFAWRAFFDAAELKGVDRVVVSESSAFPKIASIWAQTPLPVLKAWAAFHLADQAAPYLAQPFEQANFTFRGTVLRGQPQQRPRWKRAVALANSAMGEAVGRVYVAQYFPPDAKAKIGKLVEDLRVAMRARIEGLDWMSPQTKQKGLAKLRTMVVKLGYPDKWRDYSALQIRADDLYGDVEAANAFEWRRNVARLNEPVDKAEWGMTPQTVNAYYNPASNEIVFPAAQLQPPYFDVSFDTAANYGGIGGVIGHEMTHAFDDEGRQFDETGKLEDWWTPQDAQRFEARADVLGKQYDTYEPYPGAHVQGKLTMGENIADLGGLLVALDAYHHALGGKSAQVVGGLTGDQRFFLAYGQSWRSKTREASVRQQVVTDPHSPQQYRVNGVVRNVDAWYAAFAVKPGDKLYLAPGQRARIW